MRLAAVDIGTISARLLVADVTDGRVSELLRRGAIVHLGERLAATGALGDDAIDRATQAVSGFIEDAERFGVERIIAVATSAVRDARDRDRFLERMEDLGVAAEVISGRREAELSFLGAVAGHPGHDVLVVDIGGGSTEMSFGSGKPSWSTSVEVGARRVTDRFLGTGETTQAAMERAQEGIDALIRPALAGLPSVPSGAVALGGTATSVVAVALSLDPYDPRVVDGYRLGFDEVRAVRERLASLSIAERRSVLGLEPERAEVIVAGVLILERLLVALDLEHITVSEADILWGILIDAAGRSDGGVAERQTQET